MEENNKPNYVLKFNDSTLQKVEDKNSKIKKAVVIIIAIIVTLFELLFGILSFILTYFNESLFLFYTDILFTNKNISAYFHYLQNTDNVLS